MGNESVGDGALRNVAADAWIRATPQLALALRTLAIGIVTATLTWPVRNEAPSMAIDPSWIVALHIAAREHLSFGNDVIFTFGPLGFLGHPQPYLGWTSAAALVFVGTLHLGACMALYRIARSNLAGPIAWVLVCLTAFAFPWVTGWTMLGLLVFLICARAVLAGDERATGLLFALGLGLLVGLSGLGKISVFALNLALVLVAAGLTARAPGRSTATFLGAVGLGFLGAWLVTGQTIGALPTYVRSASELSAGYSVSMGQVDPNQDLGAGICALATVILAAHVVDRAGSLRPRRRAAVWALFGLMAFVTFKATFVRQGVGFVIYVATLLPAWVAFIPRRVPPAFSVSVVAGLMACLLAVAGVPIGSLIDPGVRIGALADQLNLVAFNRAQASRTTRQQLTLNAALPAEALALIRQQTTHFEPWQTAAGAGETGAIWRPMPVFQAYAAYTPFLDDVNAAFLAGDSAPDRIVWFTGPTEPLSIDARSPWFDSPAARLEMVCRYLPLGTGDSWQVLGRRPDRCGSAVRVAEVTTTAGAAFSIPAELPSGLVTIRTRGMAADPISRLVSLAFRAPEWWLRHDDVVERIPPGIEGQPVVIGTTVDAGYVGRLAIGPPPLTLSIGPDENAPGYGSPIVITLEVTPLFTSAGGLRAASPAG